MKKTLAALAAALATACASGGNDSKSSGSGPNEPNETPAQAVPLAVGTPVAGAISSATDADWYKLTVSAPTSVRIRTFDRTGLTCDPTNSAVDTYVEVRNAAGAPLTVCDQATNFQPCDGNVDNFCEDFVVTLPAGDAFVVVTGNPPFPFDYTLAVTGEPLDPGEPNGGRSQATPIVAGTPVAGRISSASDQDYYRLTLPAAANVRIQTFDSTGAACDPVGNSVDTFVTVQDANGGDLSQCTPANGFAPCDDSGLNWCEDFTISLPAGDSYVVVTSSVPMPAFDYTLDVSIVP